MRRFPLLALAALGCNPPVVINTAPWVDVQSPVNGSVVNGDVPTAFAIQITDVDGHEPIQVRITSTVDGELLSRDDVTADELLSFEAVLSRGEHGLIITADDGQSGGSKELTTSFTINGPPSTPVVEILPAEPTTDDDFRARLADPAIDPEGFDVVYAWTWDVGDGDPIAGSAFPAVVPATVTAPGQEWTFTLNASEGRNGQVIEGGITVTVVEHVTIAAEDVDTDLPTDTDASN